MANTVEERTRWGETVREFLASGQSRAAFCRGRGIYAEQLRRWQIRLQPAAGSKPLTLIPVVPPTNKGNARRSAGGAVTIRLPGEIAIEVEAGFDPGLLASVVRLLR